MLKIYGREFKVVLSYGQVIFIITIENPTLSKTPKPNFNGVGRKRRENLNDETKLIIKINEGND